MHNTTILKHLRIRKGLRQKDLAAILNVSPSTISNYENGVHSPDLDTLCKLSNFYGVSLDYLLGRTDNPYSDQLPNQIISEKYTFNDLQRLIAQLSKKDRAFLVYLFRILKKLVG